MNPQPLIAVRDVEASSRWHQKFLACDSGHGGHEYEQCSIVGGLFFNCIIGTYLGDPETKPYGNGVLLWFQIDDFDAAVDRALRAEILEQSHINENANHRECWLRDPNGCVIIVASGYGNPGASR